jgi:hypothetical protein
MIRLTTLLILTMFAAGVSNAFSHESGYVQLAGIMSTTATGDVPEVSAQFSSTGLGGTAFGFAAEAGFFVSHRVSVGFEASVPGRFDGEQIEGSFQQSQIESRHRDLLLSGVVGVQFPIAAGARIRVETGPTLVAEDTVRRTAAEILGPSGIPTGSFGPFGPETTVTRQTIGVLVGADTSVRMARHLDFVAQFRLYWVSRDDKLSTSAVLGLGSWIVQPALGLRFVF